MFRTERFPVTREDWFGWAWKVALFVLPWQTRWFADAELGGWPWEAGRWSVYVSWLPLILTVILGFSLPERISKKWFEGGAVLFLCAFFALVFAPVGWRGLVFQAEGQWWIQVLLVTSFAATLIHRRVSAKDFSTWLVVALLPQIVLGCVQYATQFVVGSKWFGMATQDPILPGVSVIEHGDMRLLRMYGSFPHPNLFGGWMVLGWLLAFQRAWHESRKFWLVVWTSAAAGFLGCVLLSYSRAAWIAALVGGLLFVVCAVRFSSLHKGELEGITRQFRLISLGSVLLFICIVAFSQREHLLARFHPDERLESKSLEVRATSLRDGVQLAQRFWMFGAGPNVEQLYLASHGSADLPDKLREPVESPHNTFLLFFVSFGVVGGLLLLVALFLFWKHNPLNPFVWSLVVLGMLDHYFWTLWAGQILVALFFLSVRLKDREVAETHP
jgi:hypothetical protein